MTQTSQALIGASNALSETVPNLPRSAILIGDSITGRGNYAVTITSLTAVGGVGSATATAHGLYPGASVFIGNATPDWLNGKATVLTRPASDQFTFSTINSGSVTATGSNITSSANGRFNDRNWFEMANADEGHPFNVMLNAGVSGQNITDIADRFQRDVLNYAPDLVQIQGGINDIQGATTATNSTVLATIKAKYKEMIDAAIAAGVIPLVCTITPLDSTASTYTLPRAQLVLRANQYLRQLADFYARKMVLFDMYAVCADPTDATGDWRTNYSTDGVHPTATACQACANALAPILASLRYVRTPYAVNRFDTWDNDNSNNQIDPNPLGIVTTGGVNSTGTGVATDIIDSYTATKTGAGATCVPSVVARADGFGNDQQFVFTATAASDAIDVVQTNQLHARVSPGDVLVAECAVTITGITALWTLQFSWEWASGGVTYTQPAAIGTAVGVVATGNINQNVDYILRTPPLTVPPAGMTGLKTRFRVAFGAAGGATIRYGRHTMTKVQTTVA